MIFFEVPHKTAGTVSILTEKNLFLCFLVFLKTKHPKIIIFAWIWTYALLSATPNNSNPIMQHGSTRSWRYLQYPISFFFFLSTVRLRPSSKTIRYGRVAGVFIWLPIKPKSNTKISLMWGIAQELNLPPQSSVKKIDESQVSGLLGKRVGAAWEEVLLELSCY